MDKLASNCLIWLFCKIVQACAVAQSCPADSLVNWCGGCLNCGERVKRFALLDRPAQEVEAAVALPSLSFCKASMRSQIKTFFTICRSTIERDFDIERVVNVAYYDQVELSILFPRRSPPDRLALNIVLWGIILRLISQQVAASASLILLLWSLTVISTWLCCQSRAWWGGIATRIFFGLGIAMRISSDVCGSSHMETSFACDHYLSGLMWRRLLPCLVAVISELRLDCVGHGRSQLLSAHNTGPPIPLPLLQPGFSPNFREFSSQRSAIILLPLKHIGSRIRQWGISTDT
ncbi:hypothetical protein CRG98_036119 [Punica granatum]|uniref:Uncharacterized protein n=1 Tax=Punica granatum TaxID=22663 RepID=A0A2I0IHN0_PUNGR|nr:hypothetical protein CRG98_036119 [Punica granatum]